MLALKPKVTFTLTSTKECSSSHTTEARSKAKHDRGVIVAIMCSKAREANPGIPYRCAI